MKTRTMNDGYVWLVVEKPLALQMFKCNEDVYKLYDDGSESLCEDENEIKLSDAEFGIGLGFVDDMNPTCPTCGAQLTRMTANGGTLGYALPAVTDGHPESLKLIMSESVSKPLSNRVSRLG